ncbi:MAG: hypothetical protein ACTHNU_11475 [Gaiellales bacterium]
MHTQMIWLAANVAHVQAATVEDPTPFIVLHWDAVAVVLICVVALWWWVNDQNSRRCSDCGYAPMWCRCPHPPGTEQRSRVKRH